MGALLLACGPTVLPENTAETLTTSETPPGTSTSMTTTATDTTDPSTSTLPTPTSTTASTAADGETQDADTFGSFLNEPDTGRVNLECSTFLQDCPLDLKCMPYADGGGNAWNAQGCFPLARDPDSVGQPCTVEGSGTSGLDSCDRGAICWDVNPEDLTGTCISLCTGSLRAPVCRDPSTGCAIANAGILALCLPTCDPLGDDCTDGFNCIPFSCSTQCVPDGEFGPAGTPCEFVNVCDPGLYCAPPETVPDCDNPVGCCSAFCELDDPDPPCLPGQICVPFEEEGCVPQPGLEHLGVCALP